MSQVLIVVVLYRFDETQNSSEAQTLRCLQAAWDGLPAWTEQYKLLLWDNSAQAAEISLTIPFDYHRAAGNDGVAGAYNGALEVCLGSAHEWMLLLDDDTTVSADFLQGMLRHCALCAGNPVIAAIAPLLFDHDFQLSPQQVLAHRAVPVAPLPSRVLEEASFAANSGVLMRVAALAAMGGYSLDFWLDYSDIYVFHQLYAAGKRLYLASDLRLQHSMTMLDYDGRMTPERYRNFLYAEQAFFDLYRTATQQAVQLLRLAARVLRQRRYSNKVFSRMTFSFLLRRLRTSKTSRLREWNGRKTLRHAGEG